MKPIIRGAVIAVVLAFFIVPECAMAQDIYSSGRIVTGGDGSSPLGNITFVGGTTLGSSAGTYTTSVDNADGSYTLHHIEVDNASNVIKHTKETFNEDGSSQSEVQPGSTGKKMGDVIGGLDTSFYSDPSHCLSINCNDEPGLGGGFDDPYSVLNLSNSIGG